MQVYIDLQGDLNPTEAIEVAHALETIADKYNLLGTWTVLRV